MPVPIAFKKFRLRLRQASTILLFLRTERVPSPPLNYSIASHMFVLLGMASVHSLRFVCQAYGGGLSPSANMPDSQLSGWTRGPAVRMGSKPCLHIVRNGQCPFRTISRKGSSPFPTICFVNQPPKPYIWFPNPTLNSSIKIDSFTL